MQERARPTAPSRALGLAVVFGLVLAAGMSCGDGSDEAAEPGSATPNASSEAAPAAQEGDPPTAQRFRVDMLREARDFPRHPSDGGGRAWIDGEALARAGAPGRWTVVYEAGELGVAVGGYVRLTVPPFWNWTDPQNRAEQAPGYTTAETEADGVELENVVPDRGVFVARIAGRALAAGETIRFVYGAGPGLARADRYAERESPFWVSVDGDGDGMAEVLADSPTIEVLPGPPAQLVLTAPSTARPGDEIELHVAVLDRSGNTGTAFEGSVDFPGVPEGVEAPASIELTAEDRGHKTVRLRVNAAGVHRLLGRALPVGAPADAEGWLGETNPIEVASNVPRILWGDLHGHSNLTDGTGTPEDYYAYARNVGGLDVAVLTDHDHWGMLKVDSHPELWSRIQTATRAAHAPGEFVTLLGYEWTSWIHGHRHVLYFEDEGVMYSSVDEAYESPLQLWDALRSQGVPAMTFAHHSAGGPIPTNWNIPPDPELEPLTEVMSVHGSSEAMDSPSRIYSPLPGNFVRDALDRGYRFGFLGSGDGHDGHPGLARLASPNAGLAAILAEDKTREAVLDALRSRRCYATSGQRIVLRCALGGQRMGSAQPAPGKGTSTLLFVHAIGTAQLRAIHVIRSGEVVQEIDCEGAWDYSTGVDLADLMPGEYVYVRIVQADRGLAWSSPFYLD
ncbi:MAG: CehA/McbA family metallohydrolase [Planctomycetota bacterium]